MSTIVDAINDSVLEMKALIEIRERFPEASMITLPDGRRAWSSVEITPEGILIVIPTDPIREKAFLVPYQKISGIPIVAPTGAWKGVSSFFDDLARDAPEIHAGVLARWTT